MKALLLAFAFAFVAVPALDGCSSLPGMQETTCTGPNCTRAEVYASIGEFRKQTALLTDSSKINATQAEGIRTQLRLAQTAVDSSTGVGGDDQLTKARSIILALRTSLLAYGATLK